MDRSSLARRLFVIGGEGRYNRVVFVKSSLALKKVGQGGLESIKVKDSVFCK